MRATALLLALALAAGTAAAATADARCGGVGSDERERLAAYARDANLSLEMFVSPGGEYLAGIDVTLRPLAGGEQIALRADGPICHLRVPPGRYRIDASIQGVSRSAQASVPASGRAARVAIAFPKSVGDRQTDAASPEEKEQAARRP